MLKLIFKNRVHNKGVSLLFSHPITFTFALSWLYAIASQIAIPLPFNLVPLSLQPLPLLLCAYFFEKTAVHAYLLYLLQGAVGLPFFSHARAGLLHLLGPTGGYLFGFLFAMGFIVLCKSLMKKSSIYIVCIGILSVIIYFAVGLVQLSFFIPSNTIFYVGLFPFFVGDFIKLFVWCWMCARKKLASDVKNDLANAKKI